MARMTILLILCLLPLLAQAQDAASPAASGAQSYRSYSAAGFGFQLSLPSSGTIDSPATEGWKEDASTAFIWYAGGREPIRKIVGRADTFGAKIDAEAFKSFCDALLEQWGTDETKHRVLTKNKVISSGGVNWSVIEIEDPTADGKGKVYYSVFITYSSDNVYVVTFYYDRPSSSEIQAFGQPVLAGFKALAQ
jgi:hypothetical protein